MMNASVRRFIACAGIAAGASIGSFTATAASSDESWDFTGHVSFDVSSDSGRVERVAVTVGDGGSGPYKAILAGDPSLPTHTLYRPRDLGAFGHERLLPVLAFANGGCRDSSGEFRNFLSEIASHGYLIIAIGPASNSAVDGSEDPTAVTRSSQLTQAIDWATQQNNAVGTPYYHRLQTDHVAVAGQSCGGMQALEVSSDPRIATTLVLNSSSAIVRPPPAASQPPAGDNPLPGLIKALNDMAAHYDPYLPPMSISMGAAGMPNSADALERLHAPVLYIVGGPKDLAYPGARRDFDSISSVPAVLVSQDVGHYPGTYRQPNGGDFAVAAVAWLDWQLKHNEKASGMFVGEHCGLCQNSKWTVATKNLTR
jgi:dienelactone hydrolase